MFFVFVYISSKFQFVFTRNSKNIFVLGKQSAQEYPVEEEEEFVAEYVDAMRVAGIDIPDRQPMSKKICRFLIGLDHNSVQNRFQTFFSDAPNKFRFRLKQNMPPNVVNSSKNSEHDTERSTVDRDGSIKLIILI